MFLPLSKLEIDVSRNDPLHAIVELAQKHRVPALVVPPDLVAVANISRGVGQSQCKVIAAVDWPRGEQYKQDKFRGLPIEALHCDGFEVLLTPRDTMQAVTDEVSYLAGFIHQQFGPLFEMRFVLDLDNSRQRAATVWVLDAFKKIQGPAYIRTTHLNKLPGQTKPAEQVEFIRKYTGTPIKFSGQVDVELYKALPVERFAATYQQAQLLIKEMTQPKTAASKVPGPHTDVA